MLPAPVGRRTLIVQADTPSRLALVRVLSHEGFDVETAPDASDALKLIGQGAIDTVLMDATLPDGEGVELCRLIKRSAATRLMPVIVLAGSEGRHHRLAAIDAGADDFVTQPVDLRHLTARLRSLGRLKRYTDELESAETVILSLALTVEARDPYTEGHCERLASLAVSLGAALGLNNEDLAALRRGGFLHDVGKIGIPDRLLLKPAPLTEPEYLVMKSHPEIGERLLGDLKSFVAVRPIVRHHHERLDGSGYPDGLRGAEIPLLAHVVSIVDSFDAMTTSRPYRRARTHAEACEELRREVRRGRMSRDLVEMFVAVIEGRCTAEVA